MNFYFKKTVIAFIEKNLRNTNFFTKKYKVKYFRQLKFEIKCPHNNNSVIHKTKKKPLFRGI